MATSRPSLVSRARHTCPMPPSPRTDTISYNPRRVPGPRDMGCQEDGAIVTDRSGDLAIPTRINLRVEDQRLDGGCAAYRKSDVVAVTGVAIIVEKDSGVLTPCRCGKKVRQGATWGRWLQT